MKILLLRFFTITIFSIISTAIQGSTVSGLVKSVYQLTKDGGYDEIQWAPDGKRFAAIRYVENKIVIFKLSEDRTSAQKKGCIYNKDLREEFAWSPDGTKIAYLLIEDGGGWTIMIAKINNEGEVIAQDILITPRRQGGHSITWSPDGTKIAFVDEVGIKIINISTKQSRLVIKGKFSSLVWLPNGKKVAYIRFPVDIGEGGFLGRVDITTGIEERLSSDNKIMESIWGFPKQGKNKVYLYQLGGGRIWMNEDGTGRIERGLAENEDLRSWSPDSSKFIYEYWEYGETEETILNVEIGIMNSDGTGKELLTSTQGFNECGAKWSPKGNYIIYTEEFSGNIYLMELEFLK